MKKSLTVLMLVLLFLLPMSVFAAEEAPFRSVDDSAGIISRAAEKYINTQNKLLSDSCGAKIIFVTVNSTDELTLGEYAENLAQSWKINSDKAKNSVIVVYNPKTHDYTAKVSDAVSRALTNVFIENCLINCTEPDFAEKNYSDAAVKTFNAIAAWYEDNYKSVNLNLTDDMSDYEAMINSENEEIHRKKVNRALVITFSVIFVLFAVLYVRRRLRIMRIRKKRRERRTRYLRLDR